MKDFFEVAVGPMVQVVVMEDLEVDYTIGIEENKRKSAKTFFCVEHYVLLRHKRFHHKTTDDPVIR